jgi:hypothetical protein
MNRWQTSLAAGEISPQAAGRFDLAFYNQGAARILNLFVLVEGGVTRVPGGVFMGQPKEQGERAFLLGFSKSNEDGVVVLCGEDYMRLLDAETGTLLEDGGGVIELAAPYAVDDLPLLYDWQSADVMFITCKTGVHQPRILIRYADDDWELNPYGVVNGPFQGRNTGTVTLNPSSATEGATGVTVAASAGIFEAGDVGNLIRFWEPYDRRPYETWQPKETDPQLSTGKIRIHDGNVYSAVVGGGGTEDNSNSPPVHTKGTASDGSEYVSWTYLHNLSGMMRITAYSSANSVTGTIETGLPTDDATPSWARGYFCDRHGWPFAGGIFQSRLFYIGTPDFPDTIWLSRTDGFNPVEADFLQSEGSDEVNDDHAVVRTLNDSEVHRLAWAVPGEQIICGHAGGIVRIGGPSLSEPITPAGANASRPEPPPGVYFPCRGIRADQSILYPSPSGRQLIALNPVDFTFKTLSARARHVGASPIRRLEYAKEPFKRAFVLREDGRLFVITYDKEQQVEAFTRMVPGGELDGDVPVIDDILVMAGPDGRDMLWYTVRRTVDGATESFIERIAVDFDAGDTLPEEAVFADAAVLTRQFNTDTAKTMTLTHTGGADAAIREAEVTLTTAGFTLTGGAVGKEYRLRRRHAPARADDVAADVHLLVTAVDGSSVTATLLNDCPAALYNTALSQWAEAVTTLSGNDHLEGQTVGVWGDGVDLGDFTVEDGDIELETAVATACVGLRKSYSALSLDIVMESRSGGTSWGEELKPKGLWADVLDTGLSEGALRVIANGVEAASGELVPRNYDDLMTAVPALKNGKIEVEETGRAAENVQIELYGNGMGPLTLRAMGVRL